MLTEYLCASSYDMMIVNSMKIRRSFAKRLTQAGEDLCILVLYSEHIHFLTHILKLMESVAALPGKQARYSDVTHVAGRLTASSAAPSPILEQE